MRKLKRRVKPYYQNDHGKLYCGNCAEVMPMLREKVDLVVTSPPYDNLRDYRDFKFPFKKIAKCLYNILKPGGVIVWVVGDQTKELSESGSSFKQALYFKRIGFHLYDTMIYQKNVALYQNNPRYDQEFEYMFIFTKNKPDTFNPIMVKCNYYKPGTTQDHKKLRSAAGKDKGQMPKRDKIISSKKYKKKGNVWKYKIGSTMASDKIAFKHPAIFPDQLAYDHILSWSNPGDIVLDPMCGSGTTIKMAQILKRRWIGIEMAKEYIDNITIKRIESQYKTNTLLSEEQKLIKESNKPNIAETLF